jgi:uncharacterized protein (DUF1330 family)
MTKGYWIVSGDVRDDTVYAKYREANAIPFKKYGARFLVRGGKYEAAEGPAKSRNVVIEFPSYQAAVDCFKSPEYKHAMSIRKPIADINIVIAEGYEGPQPA